MNEKRVHGFGFWNLVLLLVVGGSLAVAGSIQYKAQHQVRVKQASKDTVAQSSPDLPTVSLGDLIKGDYTAFQGEVLGATVSNPLYSFCYERPTDPYTTEPPRGFPPGKNPCPNAQ